MGITKLMDFIKMKFPNAINVRKATYYHKKTLAVDTSSAIYKFLVKTITFSKEKVNIPTDSMGNQTGHLIGIMYRALFCMECGIKPIWVFDGKPPDQKRHQLKRRKIKKDEAILKSEIAMQADDFQEVVKQKQRSIRISQAQINDAKTLIELMGMPVVSSYSQAEAQCVFLTKKGLAQGVISQDLDNLAFGVNLLIRQFSRDTLAKQINRQQLLKQMKLTQQQFVDFCILCGCDYTQKIPGIGPVKAFNWITQHKSIQGVIKHILSDQKLKSKHQIHQNFNYLRARTLFSSPLVNQQVKPEDLTQKGVQVQGLQNFLIDKDFDLKRIKRWLQVANKFSKINNDTLIQ